MFSRVCQIAIASTALLFASASPAQDDDDPRFRRSLAPATASFVLKPDGKPDRLEFDFGRARGTGWLSNQGDVQMETWVQHRGLLCATYETGIRFGKGSPGCTGVEWLAPVHWLTRKRQCNNALVLHTGNDIDTHMATLYSQVTCAERMLRCEGRCSQ